MVIQILEQIQVCVMPEHNDHGSIHALDPGIHQVH